MEPENYCQKCKKDHHRHLYVNLPNDTGVTIPFGPNCTTVLDIKHSIRDSLGIHPELQLLAFDRQILENVRTLGFYNILTTMEVDFWLVAPKKPLKCPPRDLITRDERFAECASLLANFGADICDEVAAMCFQTMETFKQIQWWQREQFNTWAMSVSSSTTLLEIVIGQ
ncbi:ubiquitin family domain-containing protein [Ditylenchus destructor]|nr:ubiquitin family domain-containing protein [Ditylenchus destructor]